MNRHLSKAAGLLLPVALIAGCTTSETRGPAVPDALGHIHGLGIDPADDSLYVATHSGLHRVGADGQRNRVPGWDQDLMGFTVIGPRHFLAGGHPDVRQDGPPHLGLIESTDAGRTWRTLALQGAADFHILEPAGKRLYAYDSISGTLLATTGKRTFRTIAQTPLLGLAALPGNDVLIGTNHQARLVRVDPTAKTVESLDGPSLVLLDTTKTGDLVGIAPDGTTHVSRDAGKTWREHGSIGSTPAALTTGAEPWYAATADIIYRSVDRGRTWQKVLGPPTE